MSDEIVAGALVRHDAFEHFGFVISVKGKQVDVSFDDNERVTFADPSALTRVKLGRRVKRLSNGKSGIKLELANSSPPQWNVIFDLNDAEVVVHEADLRPDMSLDPYEQAVEGKGAADIDQTLITTAAHYLRHEHFNNELVSLDGSRVDVQPHQVSVVHKVVSSKPHRYLLCDEVGLGKTIEAAMVIKELRARGEALRVLIIVPANLTRQWQFELKSKFNESFSILNTDTLRVIANDGRDENPFTRYNSVIVSNAWISHESRTNLVTQAAWDLVIVDEAHHARRHHDNRKTKLYDLVNQLTDLINYPDRSVLFLTATPMQLSSHELYSLIEMINPTLFPSVEAFNGHRQALPQLNELANALEKTSNFENLPEFRINQLSDWLEISRQDSEELLKTGDRDQILELLGKKHLITEVLIRNRKIKVLNSGERIARRWDVELTPQEKAVIDAIEDYVENGYKAAAASKSNSIGFLMTTYQKMTASSLRTVRDSLDRRRIRLEGLISEVQLAEEDIQPLAEDLGLELDEIEVTRTELPNSSNQEEISQLKDLISKLDEIEIDSKAQALVSNLEELATSTVPKVLIFTEYRGTQEYLADLLRRSGWNVNLFHGSQSSQKKDDAVEAFRSGEGRQVLIATEAGAEGRNFQFCHMLINYDLPWNPMTVEQRIGRIDRMGQKNPVMVFNFCVIGSIEERVLDVLENRINLFEQTVGGLDPILGTVADDLRLIMQRSREERSSALDELGGRLEAQVKEARRAGERLQDLFMDTKSYSVEIANRIKGHSGFVDAAMQETFMKALLKVHGTYFRRFEDLKEYQVVFHNPFLSRHSELFDRDEDRTRRVVFRSDERPDSEYVQYMAFGHPVIEAALDEVVRPQWPGSVGGRLIKKDELFKTDKGWLFIFEIDITDVRPRSIFVPAFVNDEGNIDTEVGLSLVRRSLSNAPEEPCIIDGNARNYLRLAKAVADEYIGNRIIESNAELLRTSSERLERESQRLQKYYENLLENCRIRIAATQETIDRLSASEDDAQKRIIPAWEKRLSDTRDRINFLESEKVRGLARLSALQTPSSTSRLLQVTRIEIVE